MFKRFVLVAASLAALGCASESSKFSPTVTIHTGSLTLAGIDDAIWEIELANAAGEPYFTQLVASSAYGDGRGAIAYVAPCDASGSGINTITLRLIDLPPYAVTDWVNPGPMTLSFLCEPNRDTPVTFNVTLMGNAGVGFVDIAVNLDIINCSAKYDCTDDNGNPNILVPNSAGIRRPSGVLAVACTAGPNTPLHLYFDSPQISCTSGETYSLDFSTPGFSIPSTGASNNPLVVGQLVTKGMLDSANSTAAFATLGVAWGENVGAGGTHQNCKLEARATATDGALPGATINQDVVYPYIDWQVDITSANGALACGNHALFDSDSVTVQYFSEGHTFEHQLPEAPTNGGGGGSQTGGNCAPEDGIKHEYLPPLQWLHAASTPTFEMAQTFQSPEGMALSEVVLPLYRRASSPALDGAMVFIYATDGNGVPTGSALASSLIVAGQDLPVGADFSTEFQPVTFAVQPPLAIQADTKYSIVLNAMGQNPGILQWQANNSVLYAGGSPWTRDLGGNGQWQSVGTTFDLAFTLNGCAN